MKMLASLSALVALLLAAASGPAQDRWKEFTWKEGKCSLLLPGTPKTKANSLQLVDKQGVYLVHYADNPIMAKAEPALIKQVFDKARDELVKSLKGKLLGEKDVKLGNFPGRELQVEMEKMNVYRSRMYQVGERYYQLILVAPKDAVTSKDAEKFFDSFKVTP